MYIFPSSTNSTNTPIFPGIAFYWPDQSNLLASAPTQTSIPKTSILFCGRCCLLLDDLDTFADPPFLFFPVINQLISVGMCGTADRGGMILGQSIDNSSCRGQTFSHEYSPHDRTPRREP